MSLLPPLYARFMGECLAGPLPSETKATCDNCAMCAPPQGATTGEESYFSPVTKCCTYMPELANYLVGRIVSDDAPDAAEGRKTIEARIDRRLEVTPLGLGRSRVYAMLYERSHQVFGRAQSMECPHHLADGRCGVWRHRESTCATWFCKHERGQVGKQFWRRLHDLLASVESVLSRHCVLELGLPQESLARLFPVRADRAGDSLGTEQLDGTLNLPAYEALWGPWLGRERELYRACAALVDSMSWQDVLRVGGSDLVLSARMTRAAHAEALSFATPERARQKPLRVFYTSAESARVCTYSNIDPLKLPKKLLNVLHHFDGKPTEEALSAIESQHGLRVAEGVVRKLVDFGVLEDA